MKVLNKLKWLVIIGVVFSLVLATNLIDKRNFKSINDSIVSIYEDRLVVKNVILDMMTVINKKEVAFLTRDLDFLTKENDGLTSALTNDLQKFEQSKLIYKEEKFISRLSENIELMLAAERELMSSEFSDYTSYSKIIKEVNSNLDELAHIQLEEGKRHFVNSKRKMSTIALFTQLETYFLIFLATIALIVVLYNPKTN